MFSCQGHLERKKFQYPELQLSVPNTFFSPIESTLLFICGKRYASERESVFILKESTENRKKSFFSTSTTGDAYLLVADSKHQLRAVSLILL